MAMMNGLKERDLRLDFFRGISLFIILIDHMRGNSWVNWTPGQFGYSDAACVFIFISGYTAALAFGRLYTRTSWLSASGRVALRVWQLYVAQIATVMVVAALPGIVLHMLGREGYSSVLQLDYLFTDPVDAIRGIVTLTYVPGYLDILPVYVAMVAMIPFAVVIARVSPRLLFVMSCTLWAASRGLHWNLPADPTEGRPWFFDPFSWQFMFFTGFSLSMGWLHAPKSSRPLTGLALGVVVLAAMLKVAPVYHAIPGFTLLHKLAESQVDKTTLDPLEIVHFMALAYLVSNFMRTRQHWLRHRFAAPIVETGQQSLAVFLATVILADIGGIAFDVIGKGYGAELAVNLAGIALLLAVGQVVGWFKATPWKQPTQTPLLEPAGSTSQSARLPYGTSSPGHR